MKPRLLSFLSVLACAFLSAYAVKDGPTITSNKFDNALANVFYFDDSNVILGHDREVGTVYRSADAGATWDPVDDDGQSGMVWDVWQNPFDNNRAYIIGVGSKSWVTTDKGETWRDFEIKGSAAFFRASPLSFHGRDPKKVIWNGEKCAGLACEEVAYYTTDDFKTITELNVGTRGCSWAVSTKYFADDIAPEVEDRVFCIIAGLYSPWPKDHRFVVSDDYFETQEIEPLLDEGRSVTGIISTAAVKGYVVAAAKSEGTDELALYVTDDATSWHRAEFGQHKIVEEAYTILESTNYSMQVDVLGSKPLNPMGFLFTSNSNGTYFSRTIDYTNRNIFGTVDFEMVQNINGIILVNVVDNHDKVDSSTLVDKEVISQISFDDGRTFQELTVDKKRLHLHSVTDARQAGRVFSSPAPGIVMGVGNTGKMLRLYDDGDTYISDDAGVTWSEALDGPHLYEFGNQGAVIVAIDDKDTTDYIQYSIDHGKTWKKANLGTEIRAQFLLTVPDSTTLKFLIMGRQGSGSKTQWHVFKVDFEGLHERVCKEKDYEVWPARVGEDGKASCLMGQKQFFKRRKADAECFFDTEFKDPQAQFEQCVCTEADYECDFNFVRHPDDRSKCIPAEKLSAPKGVCEDAKGTFRGPSGWRLIPGNKCDRNAKGAVKLDEDIDRPCSDAIKAPVNNEIAVEKTNFNADRFAEWYYLERADTSMGDDETIIMRTTEQDIYISRDHGKKWLPILDGKPITAIYPNPHHHDVVYFLTGSARVHYTIDRGERFDEFYAEHPPSTNRLPVLKFHPDYKDWLLWAGAAGSDDHTDYYYTTDRGDHWQTLARYARRCDFIPKEGRGASEQLVYCELYEDENPDKNLMLAASENWYADKKIHFPDILDFATMQEFIVVATKTDDRQSLRVDASVDGQTFAAAEFPRNFQVKQQQAYTVLDSSTHAVFLHVTVNAVQDHEYGTILKSNSNGTSYVLSISAVNRDVPGYVDFEKMQGLEGVAMVNVVSNFPEVQDGQAKNLKSRITHNDGAEWGPIPPPKKDALGKDYDCVSEANKATEKCSLHIHSYTERADKSATFSSPTSIGLMMAVGNVGEFLNRKDDASTDTFITRDAGITWKSVKKGSYMWEYGDQGSIIVIVEDSKPVRSLFYTLNEGESWTEFEFSPGVDMEINAITTVPSDTSRNFLLWGREVGSSAKRGIFTVNIDFSNLESRQRQCDLSEVVTNNDDYELWSPKHPMQDSNCLFGHVAQYHRKKVAAECYNGRRIDHLHSVSRNCSCTRQDFECDYNYQIQPDGSCQLVEGMEPQNHEENCRLNPNQVEFWYPTGYRRIPMTTCDGGKQLDKVDVRPCPGHEDEFQKKHGLSGVGLFFAIVLPIAVAVGVGYWVYTKWNEGWMPGFGQIRLGENAGGATPGSRSAGGESLWISVPVAVVAGVVAVAKALPLLGTSLWRSARGYVPVSRGGGGAGPAPYRSRESFGTRRQDYSQVVEDDELLGEDEDGEEV